MPGSPVGLPGSQISLRGAAPDRIGAIEVSGSRSGAHPGELRPHPTAKGASFVPQQPVRGGRDRDGPHRARHPRLLRDGDFTFTVARRPSPGSGGDGTLKLPPLPPAAIDRFRSRRGHGGAGRAHQPARGRDPEGPDLPRPVLPQGQPAAGRPADHRRPRRPRVVQAGPPRHGGHRPQGPGAATASPSSPGGRAASRSAGATAPTRCSTGTTARSRACAPPTGSPPTCTTCS